MKKFLLFAILLSLFVHSFGQKEFTILYLIPFESESYVNPTVKEPSDIERVKSYGLMGFWNGSQIALEEYDSKNVKLNVIVRDISNNESKLRNLLDNQTLMQNVDLIIGPFYSRLFTIAAEYAKQYNIPIVNPFTNRSDILKNNENVFKAKVSSEVQPSMLAFLAEQNNAFPILVFGDSNSKNPDWRTCKKYFSENKIPYIATTNSSALIEKLSPNKKQIVITFEDNSARNLIISRNLLYNKNNSDIIFIIPETWLESKTYDIEYYSQLNLHFFSNYYVDYENEKTKVFVYDYTQRFGVPPTISNFAFQGYDITKFFVEYLMNEKDIDRVKIEPISYPLSFDKTSDGGYENVNLQFLEIIDNEIVPSGY